MATITKQHEEVLDDLTKKYTYQLCNKNTKRGKVFDEDGNPRPDPIFPPNRNVLLRSSILWPGGIDPWSGKDRRKGKYLLRYYDGCTTLFIDDQPKDIESIERLIRSTRQLFFIHGYMSVYGYDTVLKQYLDMCSWNANSEYRVPVIDPIFILLNADDSRAEEAELLDMEEQALKFAKEANAKHMRVHAKFMNVPTIDYITGEELSEKSLRTEYRKMAKEKPAEFIRSYNDKTIHIKAWIEKSLDNGEISTSVIPNKASWHKKGIVICDISGLTQKENILQRLIEFSQTKEGDEFLQMLKNLYD